MWQALALLLCAAFLASIARSYHPDHGFTRLIAFPERSDHELPALRAVPHDGRPAQFTYDGQFYAQLAMEPLLRDPAIDRALDDPPYRARRILFSWTAYALGLGRPAWILQAYALQNVIAWLLLAWVLTRWIPPRTARLFALWSACLFSHGLLFSVHFALLDGPSLLLLTVAAALAQGRRRWPMAGVIAAAGLGRETNLLGAVMMPPPRSRREWLTALAATACTILPLLLWYDYVWSIYRTTSSATDSGMLAMPLAGYVETWQRSLAGVGEGGLGAAAFRSLLVVASFTVQAVFLAARPAPRDPWWRLAVVYALLVLVVDPVVWRGYPGAVTRVALPMTVGFNVLLAGSRRSFWAWFVPGNLHLVPAQLIFPTIAVP